jgi:hypothetical protein
MFFFPPCHFRFVRFSQLAVWSRAQIDLSALESPFFPISQLSSNARFHVKKRRSEPLAGFQEWLTSVYEDPFPLLRNDYARWLNNGVLYFIGILCIYSNQNPSFTVNTLRVRDMCGTPRRTSRFRRLEAWRWALGAGPQMLVQPQSLWFKSGSVPVGRQGCGKHHSLTHSRRAEALLRHSHSL